MTHPHDVPGEVYPGREVGTLADVHHGSRWVLSCRSTESDGQARLEPHDTSAGVASHSWLAG